MIVVKVEMWPHGDESQSRELGRMEIINDGTGGQHVGNYTAKLKAEYGIRQAVRRNFNRQRQSVWTLIGSILSKLGHAKGASDCEEVKKTLF